MTIAVAGDYMFWGLHLIYWHLDKMTRGKTQVTISLRSYVDPDPRSKTPGPETLAARWAVTNGWKIVYVPQKYPTEKSRKFSAKRNFKSAHRCLIFWDGQNDETKDLIKLAKKVGKKVKVINYEE